MYNIIDRFSNKNSMLLVSIKSIKSAQKLENKVYISLHQRNEKTLLNPRNDTSLWWLGVVSKQHRFSPPMFEAWIGDFNGCALLQPIACVSIKLWEDILLPYNWPVTEPWGSTKCSELAMFLELLEILLVCLVATAGELGTPVNLGEKASVGSESIRITEPPGKPSLWPAVNCFFVADFIVRIGGWWEASMPGEVTKVGKFLDFSWMWSNIISAALDLFSGSPSSEMDLISTSAGSEADGSANDK